MIWVPAGRGAAIPIRRTVFPLAPRATLFGVTFGVLERHLPAHSGHVPPGYQQAVGGTPLEGAGHGFDRNVLHDPQHRRDVVVIEFPEV